MAKNLVLIECGELPETSGIPAVRDWGKLRLDILTGPSHTGKPPSGTVYVGRDQSLKRLGVERDHVDLLGFSYDSSNKEYIDGRGLCDDLRYLQAQYGLDISRLRALGDTENLHPYVWELRTDKNSVIDRHIRKSK